MVDSSSNKGVVLVFQQLPVENGLGAEGIDFLLVLSAFEAKIEVYFVDEGCENIIQQDRVLPRYTKRFKALPDFGIETVNVVDYAKGDFVIPVRHVSHQKFELKVSNHQRVLRF